MCAFRNHLTIATHTKNRTSLWHLYHYNVHSTISTDIEIHTCSSSSFCFYLNSLIRLYRSSSPFLYFPTCDYCFTTRFLVGFLDSFVNIPRGVEAMIRDCKYYFNFSFIPVPCKEIKILNRVKSAYIHVGILTFLSFCESILRKDVMCWSKFDSQERKAFKEWDFHCVCVCVCVGVDIH